MKTTEKPRVYISYRLLEPEIIERVRRLADRLRSQGIDCRIDKYYIEVLYGFTPPNNWETWSYEQIWESDTVLMVYSDGYADPNSFTAFEVKCMEMDFNSDNTKQRKFIPIGFGSYSSNRQYGPNSLFGELITKSHYHDLDDENEFNFLLRRIKSDFRVKHPRSGIFISYSHKDKKWFDLLLKNLGPLKQQGVDIWTDQEIKAGAKWREEIQKALDSARVSILLVTPAFFDSPFIANNELPKMLEAAESEGLRIFWIPVKRSNYVSTEINNFQAAYTPSDPLSSLSKEKLAEAFVNIVSKLADEFGIFTQEED